MCVSLINYTFNLVAYSESLPENIAGHSAAGWGLGGSVIAADCGVQSPFVRQWAAATCAAPPNVIAGQYATSHCKPLLVMFM